jgi:hypothetical protein
VLLLQRLLELELLLAVQQVRLQAIKEGETAQHQLVFFVPFAQTSWN